MHFSTLLNSLALAATALAAPSIVVHNNCDYSVFVTSVSVTTGNTIELRPDNFWTEEEYFQGTGTAIKVTKTSDGLWTAKPALQLGYTYNKGQNIYYDLSTAYGYDFWGQNVTVRGDKGKDVPSIDWYGVPKPNRTLVFVGETGLTLEVCAA